MRVIQSYECEIWTEWNILSVPIDNLHVRLIFDLGKKVNSRKELIKILYSFATKFCKFTNFIMFFLAVVFDFLLFTSIKIYPNMQIVHDILFSTI